ncbi:hypothetical protein AHYW_001412 [Providencia manganoxydans]|uniref:hypothetical protein n=1 Tax=Providencia manganoxydans TaxID=2923283 RepID=UPI003D9FF28F
MYLPLVNQFQIPYEWYNTRPVTDAEMMARMANGCPPALCFQDEKLNLIDTINTPDKATRYLLEGNNRNPIENHVTDSLEDAASMYFTAQSKMPKQTPSELINYQSSYGSSTNMTAVNSEILNHGKLLSNGQILFHGGGILNNLQPGSSVTITKPFSTSFCPMKALTNGEWKGKYYDENEANIIVITVNDAVTKSFIFDIQEFDKGHEKEVLFATGATLTVTSKTLISNSYPVHKMDPNNKFNVLSKNVNAYLIHATIS